jgi:hypothetical protein
VTVCTPSVRPVTALVVAGPPLGAPRSCRLDGSDTRVVTVL